MQLTGGKIGDRLMAEAETNLAINVLPGLLSDSYEVQGRGELQLGLILTTSMFFETSHGKPVQNFEKNHF